MTLSRRTAARLYARLAGVAFLLLALIASLLFMGLAWYGIDASAFLWPWLAIGVLGLLLLVARGLRVILIVAALVGLGSTALWIWGWTTSTGFEDSPLMFAVPLALSIVGALTALGGWLVERGASSA